ncbi:sugar efflux transporter [bacterium HR30]|nr:sugar efflux transporter [bacterium HR30]
MKASPTTPPDPPRARVPTPVVELHEARGASRSLSLLRGAFGRVMAANFAFFLNFASFFLLPLFVKELGGSESTVGMVMGCGGLATLVTLPLVGRWIDRLSRPWLFATGSFAMTLAAAGYLLVHDTGALLFFLRLVQGVAFGASFTAATTLAASLAPPDMRARALGWFGVSTLLTHALAPALGEELIHRAGFPALFLAAAACSSFAGFWMIRVHDPLVPSTLSGAVGRLPAAHYLLGAVMIFFGMGFGCVTTYAASFIQAEHLGRVGAFFTAYTACAIAVRIFGGSLSDRWGRTVVVLPALVLLGTSIFALAVVRSPLALVTTGAIFGLAQGMAYPTLHAFLVDLSPAPVLGKAQALFNGSFNLGVMSSAFLFGLVADAWGQRPMFALAAATPFAAALLFGLGTKIVSQRRFHQW